MQARERRNQIRRGAETGEKWKRTDRGGLADASDRSSTTGDLLTCAEVDRAAPGALPVFPKMGSANLETNAV